jgi:hypothetical protein
MLSSRVQDQHFSFVRLVQLIQASHDIHYPFYKPREYLMFLVKTSNPTRRAHYPCLLHYHHTPPNPLPAFTPTPNNLAPRLNSYHLYVSKCELLQSPSGVTTAQHTLELKPVLPTHHSNSPTVTPDNPTKKKHPRGCSSNAVSFFPDNIRRSKSKTPPGVFFSQRGWEFLLLHFCLM